MEPLHPEAGPLSPDELEELLRLPVLPPGFDLENVEHWILIHVYNEFVVMMFKGLLFFFSPFAPDRQHKQGGMNVSQMTNNTAAAAQAQAHMAQAQALMGR